jgi:hypothetical protein
MTFEVDLSAGCYYSSTIKKGYEFIQPGIFDVKQRRQENCKYIPREAE